MTRIALLAGLLSLQGCSLITIRPEIPRSQTLQAVQRQQGKSIASPSKLTPSEATGPLTDEDLNQWLKSQLQHP
jgi:hypothetical protein